MTPRFYHVHADINDLKPGNNLVLTPEIEVHALKVLRLKIDDCLILFSGLNGECLCKIVEIKPKAKVEILECLSDNRSSPFRIHLGQGIAKGDKMDFIIQKAVELGCCSITPLLTEKSQVKLDRDRLSKKHSHWQKIVISAAEQSGLNILPRLNEPMILQDWLNTYSMPGFVFHTSEAGAGQPVSTIKGKECSMLIGSESGFTDKEAKMASDKGLQLATLGPRILRTETATITAISLIQAKYGDLPKF